MEGGIPDPATLDVADDEEDDVVRILHRHTAVGLVTIHANTSFSHLTP